MEHMRKHLSVRLPRADYELLEEVSRARGIDVSDFVRQTLRKELAKLSYLGNMEKKALGIAKTDRNG